jgi:hypothetical protein
MSEKPTHAQLRPMTDNELCLIATCLSLHAAIYNSELPLAKIVAEDATRIIDRMGARAASQLTIDIGNLITATWPEIEKVTEANLTISPLAPRSPHVC